MKTSFTRRMKSAGLSFLFLLVSSIAVAQYTSTTFVSGQLYTALTRDAAGNIYYTRVTTGSGGALYEVVKYNTSTTASSVILTNLTHTAQEYPFGIAVTSNGDVYVSTDFTTAQGKIIKLTAPSYTASDFQTGRYFTALAVDAQNNLYSTEYDGSANFQVVRYSNLSTPASAGTVIYNGLKSAAGYSYPTGLAVDASGNVLVADAFSNNGVGTDGGRVLKLTPGTPYSVSTVSSGKYATSLAVDDFGNLYSNENNGVAGNDYKLVKYTNAAGAATTVYSSLHTNGVYYPWGVAFLNNKIYGVDGDDGSNGGAILIHTPADVTPPATPLNPAASQGNTENMISWNAVSDTDISGYKIYGGTSANPTVVVGAVSAPALTFTHTGLTNGTTYYYRISAVDLTLNESPQSAQVSATPTAIAVNQPTLSPGTVNTAYSQTFTAGGGTAPYTFTLQSGTLPPGLTLVNGTLSGTPTTGGTYNFVIRITDASTAYVDKSYSFVIQPTSQTITFSATDTRTYGDADYVLTASSTNAGTPVTYAVTSGTAATVTSAGTVHISEVGTVTITASQAASASYTAASASQILTINPKVLNFTATVTPKVYDGTRTATVTLTDNRINGDVFTAAYTSALYDTKNIGVNKPVDITGISITGAGASKYTYSTTASSTGNITARALLVSAAGINKPYDGTAAATVTLTDDRITGDVFTLAYTAASFNTKDVGTAKPVAVTGISVTGTDAGNYTFNTTANTTANITAKALLVSATGINKVYDGTTAATVTLTDDRVNGDILNLAYLSAAFNTKDAGTAKPVSVTGISVTGTDAGNYTANTTAAATADITAKALTISASGLNKQYDATLAATVTLTDDRQSGDVITLNYASALFDTKNVGTNKNISVTGITVTGANAANYSFNTTAAATANITARPLTVTATGNNKIYDGTTAATVTLLDNRLAGDVLTPVYASAVFNNQNVGTGKAISVTGISISGTDAGNYTPNTTTGATANITRQPLVIRADDKSRLMGFANPPLTASYSGFVNGETSANLSQQPVLSTTANMASAQGIYPITVSGAAAANYDISYVNGTMTVTAGYPTSVTLAAIPLFENQPAGTSAGTLSSTSEDPAAVFSYSLVSGAGDTDNAYFEIVSGSNQVRTRGPLNYEAKSTYSIRVRSVTQYNLSLDQVFTISLSDVNEQPAIAAIADLSVCYTEAAQVLSLTGISAGEESGQNVSLSVSSTNSLLINTISVGAPSNGTAQLFYTIRTGQSGTAVVTVTVTDDGGTANGGTDTFSRSFTINVNPLPGVTITSDQGSSVSKGATVRLTASGGSTYQWADANGIISGQNSATLQVRPSVSTTYSVTVNNGTCTSVATYALEVREDYELVSGTNIVTPNGDGVNDKFIIRNIDMYPVHILRIYDRGGRQLYQVSNYNNDWDATLNGAPLAEDSYYYIIDFNSGRKKIKGFITVVRD